MSEPHTLASAILMSMAPGSGSGTGYSRISNGVPVPWKTARRAVSGMGRSSLVAFAEQREGAGRVGEDDGRGRTEIAAIQLRELRDTEQAHGDAHLGLEQLERADQAGRPRGGASARRPSSWGSSSVRPRRGAPAEARPEEGRRPRPTTWAPSAIAFTT